MNVANIGVTTVTPSTGIAGRSDNGGATFTATESPERIDGQNAGNGAAKTAERVILPATLTAAKIRGYGDFVDKTV